MFGTKVLLWQVARVRVLPNASYLQSALPWSPSQLLVLL